MFFSTSQRNYSFGCIEMTLFDSIKTFIQICQLSGLSPYSLNQSTLRWELNPHLSKLSIVIFSYNLFICVFTIVQNDLFINHKNPPIRVVLIALVLSWTQVHAISVLVELFIKRKQQVKLLNMFEALDRLFQQQLNMHADYSELKRNCRRIIAIWLVIVSWFSIAQFFYYFNSGNKFALLFFSALAPSFALSKLSYLYSIFLFCLISENINVVNKYLKSVTKQNGYYISESFINEAKMKRTNYKTTSQVNLMPDKLQFMKDVYCHIWEASGILRNLMSYSLVIGLSNEFFLLLFDGYWIFLNFIRPEPGSAFAIQMTFICIALISMYLVTFHYRDAINMVIISS